MRLFPQLRSSVPCMVIAIGLLFNANPGLAQKKQKPNIIYILADDMGYGDVHALNKNAQVHTPNLDRLVNQGMSFTDAHSGSAVCTPTRYGVITGRYAFRSSLKKGVLSGYSPALIENDRFTVADLLKKAGYQTSVIGKWHLGLDWNTDQSKHKNIDARSEVLSGPNQLGFDYSYIIPASLDMPPYSFIENGKLADTNLISEAGQNTPRGVFWRSGQRAATFKIENTLDRLIDKSKDYIRNAETVDKPFFLYLPLTSPHTPWLPAQKFRGSSAAGIYGDFIAHTDAAVGEILNLLDSLKLQENTLVIFTSDNGADWKPVDKENFPLHQANYIFRGEKSDIWEGGHHVPFIARWPKEVAQGKAVTQTICLTDLVSTLAALTGQQLPDEAAPDSFNFLPVLEGATSAVRKDIIHHSIDGMFAIRRGKWKFVDGKGSGGWSDKTGKADDPEGQLYDLDKDPQETTNLYTRFPVVVKELKVLLDQQKIATQTRPK